MARATYEVDGEPQHDVNRLTKDANAQPLAAEFHDGALVKRINEGLDAHRARNAKRDGRALTDEEKAVRDECDAALGVIRDPRQQLRASDPWRGGSK